MRCCAGDNGNAASPALQSGVIGNTENSTP
ncbi:hypothetical protein LMG21510_00003 [Cupriavidus respiraculi]|uniref:Uncharacterized protein n=1 Tax=Cupriavidus respiraculi TaxID=195930 RepID=A0ABM8WD82_9BURK|nr:hypothetical protein LMG21510_00003 [Cupriavidus respiraculi]